jgi:long-chain acyl-CoA synthetase
MAKEVDLETIGNVASAFRRTAREHADRVAVRSLDGDVELTWGGLRDRVDALAGGLAELGLGRGDTLAIMLTNRPEFHAVDLAAMMLGGVPFSIYQTLSPEQIAFVVRDSGARIAVIERAFLETFSKAAQDLPSLEHVIVVDGEGEQGTLRLDEIERPGLDLDAAAEALGPDDLLTLIYTSGTTGPPKGVELTHGAMLATAEAFHDVIQFPEAARVISWLPSAHIAERAAHHYLPVIFGFSVTTCPDPGRIIEVLPQVRPHWFFAVPRVWEKMKAGLESRLASLPEEQRAPALAGLEAAKKKVRLEQAGEPVPAELAEAAARADEALFSKLRFMLGFDQAIAVIVGAAPTPPEVLEFFHAIGIPVGELWGMSETCGAGTTNPPGAVRIGTVGPPVKGMEIRLADDGEILVRGRALMRGYRNLPDKTREVINEEGWLHTGDLGVFDEHGYLRIIDRKKEIIINAAGKNMSPANIESTLNSAGPLVGQVCVIGDARSYNTALVVLDADYAPNWAEQQGLPDRSLELLSAEESVRAAVEAEIASANERLARVEQIKKFRIVAGDWLPGGDELTPTMKLKRRPIAEKYADLIESMYSE